MKFNKLIPELSVADIETSLDFYVGILGFTIEFERPQDKFAFLSYQGSQIMLEQNGDGWITGEILYPRGRGINFEIETDDLNSLIGALLKKNVSFFKEPRENHYQTNSKTEIVREFLIQDPDGYLLRFQQVLEEGAA
jgi:catechol 2,3-dioxygenase-like lactoylglutathione lyase family enzyme